MTGLAACSSSLPFRDPCRHHGQYLVLAVLASLSVLWWSRDYSYSLPATGTNHTLPAPGPLASC